MEENNLLPENETMEVITVMTEKSNKGLGLAIGLGVTALVGGIVYKKVIKPRRQAKSNSEVAADVIDVEEIQED